MDLPEIKPDPENISVEYIRERYRTTEAILQAGGGNDSVHDLNMHKRIGVLLDAIDYAKIAGRREGAQDAMRAADRARHGWQILHPRLEEAISNLLASADYTLPKR